MTFRLIVLTFGIAVMLAYPLHGVGLTREELIKDLRGKLDGGSVEAAMDAADKGLKSDDRIVRQMLLEPVLQHKDSRVRQIGLLHLVEKMEVFHIELELSDEREGKAKDRHAYQTLKRYQFITFRKYGFDEKTGLLKTNFSGGPVKLDQSGLSLVTSGCRLSLGAAEAGRLVGAMACRGESVLARMALP